jgi:hypothetical protein
LIILTILGEELWSCSLSRPLHLVTRCLQATFSSAYVSTLHSWSSGYHQLNSLALLTFQMLGQRSVPKLTDRRYDNALPDQDCRTPQGGGGNEYGAMVEWLLAGRTRSISEKPAAFSFRPPQISYDMTRDSNQVPAVRSYRLITWAVAWPMSNTPVWDLLGLDLCHEPDDFGAFPRPG